MGRLTHHFTAVDIRFPVLISQDGDEITAAIAAGRPPTPAAFCTAVLDTGTNISIITPAVAARLGLKSIARTTTNTAAGPTPVSLYYVSVGLPPVFGLTSSVVLNLKLKVGALPDLELGVDVLFGLDLLLNCRLLIDGPARTFTLEV